MQKLNLRQIVIILVHALVGWVLCGATMFAGMAVTTIQNALIIHAIAAALIFILLSYIYFRRFNFTTRCRRLWPLSRLSSSWTSLSSPC